MNTFQSPWIDPAEADVHHLLYPPSKTFGVKPPIRSCVYFIASERGMVKIGHAKDIEARLRALQVGADGPLELLGVTVQWNDMPLGLQGKPRRWDRVEAETLFHNMFEHRRVRGEWFRLSPDDLLRALYLSPSAAASSIRLIEDQCREFLGDVVLLRQANGVSTLSTKTYGPYLTWCKSRGLFSVHEVVFDHCFPSVRDAEIGKFLESLAVADRAALEEEAIRRVPAELREWRGQSRLVSHHRAEIAAERLAGLRA